MAQTLINVNTNLPEEVSHDNLHNAIFSGGYGLPTDQPVALKNPDGNIVDVDPQHVRTAVLKSGYSVPSEAEFNHAQNVLKHGDAMGKVSTFAAGMLDQPFIGPFLQSATGYSKQKVEELKDANPWTYAGGQFAGIPAALLVAPEAEGVAAAKKGLDVATAAYEAAQATGDVAAIASAEAQVAGATSAINLAKNAFTTADAFNPASAIAKGSARVGEAVGNALPSSGGPLLEALKNVGTHAAMGAAGNAAYSAGELANEYSVGDPNLTAGQIFARVGLGGLYGAVLGGGFGLAAEGVTGASKLFGTAEKAAVREAVSMGADASVSPETRAMSQLPKDGFDTATDTLNKAYEAAGIPLETPQAAEAVRAQRGVPEIPVPGYEMAALEDPEVARQLAVAKQGNTELSTTLRANSSKIKGLAQNIVKNNIDSLSEMPAEKSEMMAGEKIQKWSKDLLDAEDKRAGKIIGDAQPYLKDALKYPGEVVDKLISAVPEIAEHLEYNGIDGPIKFPKYDSGDMGFSEDVHQGINMVLNVLNKDVPTLQKLRNVDLNIGNLFKDGMKPAPKAQLTAIKKALSEFVDKKFSELVPDKNLKQAWKDYAVNKNQRRNFQKILGGSLKDGDLIEKNMKPEMALNKIFSNTNYTQYAKDFLGEEKFNSVLKDFLSIAKQTATDDQRNGYKSNAMHRFLKDNSDILHVAMGEGNPKLQKIKDANTISRMFADSVPANPSGTAPTYDMLKKANGFSTLLKAINPKEWLEHGYSGIFEGINEKSDAKYQKLMFGKLAPGISMEMADKAVSDKVLKYRAMNFMAAAKEKIQNELTRGVKSFLTATEPLSYGAARAITGKSKENKSGPSQDELFQKRTKRIYQMANNSEAMQNKLEAATENLTKVAPQTAQALQSSMMTALNFLGTKIPRAPTALPLQAEFVPSKTDISSFNRYYEAVNKPLNILNEMKLGKVSKESIETLNAVHPEMRDAIKKEIFDRLTETKGKLPYQKKLMLSAVLGTDMEPSTVQANIMSNQLAFSLPSSKNPDGMIKPTQKGLEKIDVAGRSLTPFQKSTQRVE